MVTGVPAEVVDRAALRCVDALPGANERSGSLGEPLLSVRDVLPVRRRPGGAQGFMTKANLATLFTPLENRIDGLAMRIERAGHLGGLRPEERRQLISVERRECAREGRHERFQPRRTAIAERARDRVHMSAWTWTIDGRPGEMVAERWIDLLQAESVDRNIRHVRGAEAKPLCPPLGNVARAGDRHHHTRGGAWRVQHRAASVVRPVHTCVRRDQANQELRLAVIALPVHDAVDEARADTEVKLVESRAFGPWAGGEPREHFFLEGRAKHASRADEELQGARTCDRAEEAFNHRALPCARGTMDDARRRAPRFVPGSQRFERPELALTKELSLHRTLLNPGMTRHLRRYFPNLPRFPPSPITAWLIPRLSNICWQRSQGLTRLPPLV
ncbi:hypothetical protein WME83_48130 [Sorangium sp. So ce385]